MPAQNIEARVMKTVAENYGVTLGKFTPASNFTEHLGGDSLDQVEFVMTIEDDFGIEIPDEDAEKLVTAQAAIDYIASREGAK